MSAPASAHAEVRPASSYGNGGASVRGKRKYDKKDHSSADGAGADGAKRFKHGGGADSWKKKGGAGSYKKPIALTRKDRDQQKRDRKAQKPNADIIAEANKIWQTSFTTISAGERAAHITSLLSHMSGKMHEVGLKHDASRAIQLAIKYANEEQKHTIVNQLTGHFKQLSEEHYGHYIIIKMLSNDTKRGTAKAACLKEFKTHINKLSTQPDSAKVLDFLYASVKQKDQNSILQEFYSPEFVVFAEEETTKEKTLTEILKMKPEKKNQILENIRKYLDKAFEKNMVVFRFLHALLLQYLTHASLTDDAAFLPSLYQYIPALHHSVDGCKIICHLLSVGTAAKDRKAMLKYFKGVVGNMADRQEGVWVLTCALDVVDDTVLLDKTIFAELLPTLKDQLTHQYSSRIYLHILNSHDAGVFSRDEQENYSVSGKWILNSADAAAGADQAKKGEQGKAMLSKKDPAVKRLELLGYFLAPLLQILSTLPSTLSALLRSNTGHHLLVEAIREAWRLEHDKEAKEAAASAGQAGGAAAGAAGGEGSKKKKGKKGAVKSEEDGGEQKMDVDGSDEATPATPASGSRFPAILAKKLPELHQSLSYVFTALANECSGDASFPAAGAGLLEKGGKENLLEDRFGHYVIKRVLALQPTPDTFVSALLDAVQSRLPVLAVTNRPAFVLATILEKDMGDHAKRLRKELKPLEKQIIQAAKSGPPVVEETAMDTSSSNSGNGKFQKKNAIQYSGHSTTNAGVELLSKLLQGLPTGKEATATASSSTSNGKKASKSAASPSLKPAASPALKPSATPAKGGKGKKAAGAAAEAEPVKMEVDDQPAPTKTPAKAAASTKKAATTGKKGKKSADAMED